MAKYLAHCCNTVMESKHRHHFVSCECGRSNADGGDEYSRLLWSTGDQPPTHIEEKETRDES